MQLVIIESPYRGDIEKNQKYLNLCIRDCIRRGESPYASHQMLTDALDDNNPTERDAGIRAGYAWWKVAKKIAFYTDLGWSDGMRQALYRAKNSGKSWEERRLNNDLGTEV